MEPSQLPPQTSRALGFYFFRYFHLPYVVYLLLVLLLNNFFILASLLVLVLQG